MQAGTTRCNYIHPGEYVLFPPPLWGETSSPRARPYFDQTSAALREKRGAEQKGGLALLPPGLQGFFLLTPRVDRKLVARVRRG